MNTKIKFILSDLTRCVLQLLILLTIIELCFCAPQRYYNYPNYYRGIGNGYSRYSQPSRTAYSQSSPNLRRRNSYAYSSNLLADAGKSLRTQAQKARDAIRKSRVSKADQENAKFVGANNQESDEESQKTLGLLLRNPRRQLYNSPCFRDASGTSRKASSNPKGQGRFLFDLNVYNVYPNGGGLSDPCGAGIGGGLGGGGGGGLFGAAGNVLADALADAIRPAPTPLENFLTLFAPGILQNSLAATVPSQTQLPLQDDIGAQQDDIDPAVDPAFNQRPLQPVRRPNRVYFDSAGATPITPAQLIGGVATTVNGIIQQLTGNIQPVYPAFG